MPRRIFLLDQKGSLSPLDETDYDSEDLLQALLEDYPDLLGGDQINEHTPRRWILIDRECGIPNEPEGGNWWSLDHLFVDQDAIPTLVEVKRADDPRIRREVVGQVLDYAANLVAHLPVQELRRRFEERHEDSAAAAARVADLLEEEPEDLDYDDFWVRVGANLSAGRLRLLFVADWVPSELRRVVEFLNEQMGTTEVLAVEIKQFSGRGLQTLVPRLLGQTAATQRKSGTTKRKWDEESFFRELEANDPAAVAPARRLFTWAKDRMPEFYWGEGAQSGSFFPGLTVNGVWSSVIALWTGGGVEFQFQHLLRRAPFDDDAVLEELFERFTSIDGIELPRDRLRKRPSIPIALLAEESRMNDFLVVLDWFLETHKSGALQ